MGLADTTVWGQQQEGVTLTPSPEAGVGGRVHPGGPQPWAHRCSEVPTGLKAVVPLCCFEGTWRCQGDTPVSLFPGTSPACACGFLHVLRLPWGQQVQVRGYWPQLQQPWTCPASPGCPVLRSSWCRGSGLLLPALLCQGEASEPPVLCTDSLRCPKPGRLGSTEMFQQKPAPVPRETFSHQNSVS